MRSRTLALAEIATILLLGAVPLFVTFPYRVNIFLSWEGAYRMSQGQLPFRDFGTPLGGMYWVIPAIFMKVFGPQMISLVKAQVFINIISGLAFRSILRSLSVPPAIRFASVLFFCISYSFFNFWPWYNHTVIVYELVALAFLTRYAMNPLQTRSWLLLLTAAFFTCCSFLTKQDGGGLAFFIMVMLLIYVGLNTKNWKGPGLYLIFFTALISLVALIFGRYGFGYWFNHGQPPHNSRMSLLEVAGELLRGSQWIKAYFLAIVLLACWQFKTWGQFLNRPAEGFFLLLTLGILAEAAIFQITSYTPPDNNIFFHSFGFAYLLTSAARLFPRAWERPAATVLLSVAVLLFWSGSYFKYIERFTGISFNPSSETRSPTGENVINKNTFMLNPDSANQFIDEDWVESPLPVFHRIYMPRRTADGIDRLMKMDLIKQGRPLTVLNMSELTPLAAAIPFTLERNPALPLWHHLGVGMFNKQAAAYEARIRDHFYDLVLFEYIPKLNNFYPFRVRDSLRHNYQLVDSFFAPRRGETDGQIEVYVKPAP